MWFRVITVNQWCPCIRSSMASSILAYKRALMALKTATKPNKCSLQLNWITLFLNRIAMLQVESFIQTQQQPNSNLYLNQIVTGICPPTQQSPLLLSLLPRHLFCLHAMDHVDTSMFLWKTRFFKGWMSFKMPTNGDSTQRVHALPVEILRHSSNQPLIYCHESANIRQSTSVTVNNETSTAGERIKCR